MADLYFECTNGISGDMTVAALLDLGADRNKLDKALNSLNLHNEFTYEITQVYVNSIKATDFNVIINNEKNNTDNNHHQHHKHEHHHRNIEDINKIIDRTDASENAKQMAKKIFNIVAQAESKVHNKDIKDVHFHEIGAIDSIVDIISFAVLYDDINPQNVYFSKITEGMGTVKCAHGLMNVPVPAVCEITSQYKIPIRITNIEGEMITPTGIAIAAALYNKKDIPQEIIINKVGYGAGKRAYPNPVLRVMKINEK